MVFVCRVTRGAAQAKPLTLDKPSAQAQGASARGLKKNLDTTPHGVRVWSKPSAQAQGSTMGVQAAHEKITLDARPT